MNRRIIAFIIMFICLFGIIIAAVIQYTFNGLLFMMMVVMMGCVAYLMKHDFIV